MKNSVLLIISLFLMIFMVGSVNANQRFFFRGGPAKVNVEPIYTHQFSIFDEKSDDLFTIYINNLNTSFVLNSGMGLDNSVVGRFSFEYSNQKFKGEGRGIVKTYMGSDKDTIMNNSAMEFPSVNLVSDKGSIINGHFKITFAPNGYNLYEFEGVLNDNEERISALEDDILYLDSKISEWKDSITNTISDIWTAITGHTDRIEELENATAPSGGGGGGGGSATNKTFPEYLNYLSSSDRKKIVCGYGETHRLTHLEGLEYSCDFEYKNLSSGKERVSCKCKNL